MKPVWWASLLLALAAQVPLLRAQAATDSILARPITLQLQGALLSDALVRLRRDHAVPIAWSGDLLPPDCRVTLAVRNETLRNTLRVMLQETGLGFALTRQGTVVIVPRSNPSPDSYSDSRAPEPATERIRFATGLRQLDQIVVMGSPVAGGPRREQPTAVSVLDQHSLRTAPHSRLSDLVRSLLPGVVLWDRGPAGPPAQVAAVRGISSFTTRGLKTYVDDIELASPELFTLVDGRAIEQIELIRGPQGAALYGPDALNGIMQIVTRKGRPGQPLQVRATGTIGSYDRPDLSSASLWQDYSAGLSGGAAASSFGLTGSLARTGSSGTVPWLELWTAQGGAKLVSGSFILTASARAGRHEYGAERLGGSSTPPLSVPLDLSERGAGITLTHIATAHWKQTLIAGHHWVTGEREPAASVLLTPRLPLGATHETAWRSSLRYSSTVDAPVGNQELSASAGLEHGRRRLERAERRPASSSDLVRLYDEDLRSTGLFGQGRVRLGHRLVLNGGSRAEWSSSVGPESGTAWASTAGISWSQPIGHSVLRLRSAWGRGIRPPEPGMSRAMAVSGLRQEANDDLAPETQSGIEAGIEFHLGESLVAQATWYDQTADDLIQQVPRRSDGVERVYQFQNLGSISNRGLELEGGLQRGGFLATATVYFNQSRVDRLAPSYTGYLRPGDELPEVPAQVGAVRLRYERGRLMTEAGGSWLGSWIGYDWAAVLGDEPSRPTDRDYWIEYPGGFRPWVAASLRLGRNWALFTRIDNLANAAGSVRTNLSPPVGRSALVGLGLEP